MKLILNSALLLLIFNVQLSAQSLRGRVIEANTQNGIPYVNVQLGNRYGVISNEEGYFVLQRKSVDDNTAILFSSMGFETLEIPLSDFENDQVIPLKPATYVLDEVFLSDKQLTAEEILEKFKAGIKENHVLNAAQVQVFTRLNDDYKAETFGIDVKKASFMSKAERREMNENMKNLGNKITENSSIFYQERLSDVFIFEDTLMTKHQKALKLINRDKTFDTDDIQEQVFFELLKTLKSPHSFKVRTGIIPIDKDVSLNEMIEDLEKSQEKVPDTLYNKSNWQGKSYKKFATKFTNDFFTSPKYYTYELKGVTTVYGEPCYHIQFTPDRRKGKYVGDLYIHTRDFGMVSYKYDLEEGRKAMNVNLKFVLGIKVNTYIDSGFYVFSKTNEDSYYPKYIKQVDGNYAYINRSLAFKENNPKRSERKKLNIEFELEYNTIETIEYVGVQYQSISPELASTLKFEDYILIDEIDQYDLNYWKDYNIIEATEAIKTYD
jgi:hypothetical protein